MKGFADERIQFLKSFNLKNPKSDKVAIVWGKTDEIFEELNEVLAA